MVCQEDHDGILLEISQFEHLKDLANHVIEAAHRGAVSRQFPAHARQIRQERREFYLVGTERPRGGCPLVGRLGCPAATKRAVRVM